MIPRAALIRIARCRLKDAESLYRAGRFDASAYICGYAIELKLKARICRTLGWASFPSTRGEFQDLTSFKTHDLQVLLLISGVETKVLSRFRTEWDEMAEWEPEMRYNAVGTVTERMAKQMLTAAKTLMRII